MSQVISFIIKAVNQTMQGLNASKASIQRFTMWAKVAMLGVAGGAIIRKFASAIDDVVKKARETKDFSLIKEEDVARLELIKKMMAEIKQEKAAAGGTWLSKRFKEFAVGSAGVAALLSGKGLKSAAQAGEGMDAQASAAADAERAKAQADADMQRRRDDQAADHEAHMKNLERIRDSAATEKRAREDAAKDHEKVQEEAAKRAQDNIDTEKRARADAAEDYKARLEQLAEAELKAIDAAAAARRESIDKWQESHARGLELRDRAINPEKRRAHDQQQREAQRDEDRFQRELAGAYRRLQRRTNLGIRRGPSKRDSLLFEAERELQGGGNTVADLMLLEQKKTNDLLMENLKLN